MADFTPNYNLKKPLRTEYYNVADMNGNSDIVDGQLKAVNDRVGLVEGDVVALENGKVDKVVGKDLSDENYTIEEKNKVANVPDNTIAQLNDMTQDFNAQLADIENRSLKLENKILNGNFVGILNWSASGSTLSALNNELIGTVNTLTDFNRVVQVALIPTINDVYYARMQIKPKYATQTYLQIGAVNSPFFYPTPNVWNKLSAVIKPTGVDVFRIYHATGSSYIVGDTYAVKEVKVINLTALFGAGNEPTALEMDKLIELLGGWFDGAVTATDKMLANWQLSFIRTNTKNITDLSAMNYGLELNYINGSSMVAHDTGAAGVLYMLEHRMDSLIAGAPAMDELYAQSGGRYIYKSTDGVNFVRVADLTALHGGSNFAQRQITLGDGKHIIFNSGTEFATTGNIEVYSADYLTKLSTKTYANMPYPIHGISQNPFSRTVCYAEYSTSTTASTLSIFRLVAPFTGEWVKVLEVESGTTGRKIRHFHVCAADPYIANQWYATSGDEPDQCCMWSSSDDGATWTEIKTADSRIRTTQLHFDTSHIYWIEDNPGGGFYRMPKTTKIIETLIPKNVLSGEGYNLCETPFGYVTVFDKITAPYSVGGEHLDPNNSYIYFIDYNWKYHVLAKIPWGMMGIKSRGASAISGKMYTQIRPTSGVWNTCRMASMKLIHKEMPYGYKL